ncbi:MAG: hypothetical protein ABSB22_04230 [Thermodesulfobacteriota bacterium]
MGEIKSTLELAMERTKRLAISDEEKIEIRRKEILQKATSLSNRYREGHLPANEVLKEIGRMEEKTAIVVKEFLLSQWIDALSLNGEGERLFKGIESLRPQEIEDAKQKLLQLLSHYQKDEAKVKQEVRTQATEALRREGIYGSAVEANIEEAEFLKSKLKELRDGYGVRLNEIKEKLRLYR